MNRSGNAPKGVTPFSRHAQTREIGADGFSGIGKEKVQPLCGQFACRHSRPLSYSSEDRSGAFYGYLLTHNRPDRRFEGVPCAGQAHPTVLFDDPFEQIIH